ncbi:uncharacterized protein LOC108810107 [Raphanus sativus]|uniref:Uncharacterized protein LOC108810107 n=1 Tax=Raphanus sativus TaxID=3726 RepID=A0A9W3BU78_RAPSA|nr:uncharacterized protein LOC108810107 [Raphanus sativus]
MGGGFFVADSCHGEHKEGHVTTFVVVACIVAAMGSLLFGYDLRRSTANTKRASHSLHLLPLPRCYIRFFPRFNRNKALWSESLDDLRRSHFSLRSFSVVTSDPTTVVPETQLSSSSSYLTYTSSSSLLCEETASSTAEEMAMEFQQAGIETKLGEYQQFLEM